ncbi:hypothetical protein CC2G_009757 [Coprinopsis cinerea AmutBmut pab1-1]|nr:hypothetical protein CC2G_009757 [Coprinopsis cinerea AmutBmut pab1-1]
MALLPDLFNLNCVGMACIALVVYDYLCTLVDEVEYVWRSRWSIGIPLFFLNRYLVFVDQALLFHFSLQTTASPSTCGKLFQSGIWMLIFGGNVASFIIYMQTCAIWANQWKVVIPLLVLQLAKLVTSLVFSHLQWSTSIYTTVPGGWCAAIPTTSYLRYIYAITCATEAITIGFTVVRAYQHIRGSKSSWVTQLYRSGILYCICILVFSMSNAIISEALEGTMYVGVMTRPQRVIESVLGSRVLLVIFKHRRLSENPETDLLHTRDSSPRTIIFTSIFNSNPNYTQSSRVSKESNHEMAVLHFAPTPKESIRCRTLDP